MFLLFGFEIIGVGLAILFLFVILSYNSIISKRNQISNAFAGIDTILKKRFDLIPNLVETVKGYAKHEQSVFENVTKARAAMLGAGTISDKVKADDMLSGALKSLFAVAENYPELKANENFLHLQRTLAEIEEQISAARRFHNSSVLEYNNAIQTFPGNLFATLFGFKSEVFFQITNSEREVPKTF
ncbi:LemA family protein [Candidatus Micrarchaeota archaeon]|nr:LemA family protein [Candidatus Micrarchaeota archaeon]